MIMDKENKDRMLHLVVPAKAEYIAMVRLVVAAVALESGFSDDSIADLKVAISEASANVVRHAYQNGFDEEKCVIEISCYRSEGCMLVKVIDYGCGMTIPPPPSSGLGFGIIGSLMDKVDVETGEGGTTVIMEKEPVSSRP